MAFVPSSVASSGKPQDLYFALKEDIPAAQVLSQNGNTISLSGGGGGVNVAATTAVSTSTQKLTGTTYMPGFLSTKFDGQVVVDGGLSGTSRLTGGTVEITRDTVNPAIVMSRQDIVGEGRIEYDGTKVLMGPVGISGEIYDSFGSPGAAGQQLQSSGPGLPFVWGAGSGIGLTAVVAGSNIGVDNTNPIAPVVNLAVTSTIDMSGNDLSGANAITAQNGFFTQTLNANSIKSTTDVQTATVTATGLVSGLSLAASNLQLQYNDASGGLVTVPAGKALSLTSGTTNAFHINSAGNVGIRMINTGANNVEVAGSLSATGQVRGVGASFSGEVFTQAVTPNFANTYDLGRPTARWATVNTVNVNCTGTVTAGVASLSSSGSNGRLAVPAANTLTLTTGANTGIIINSEGNVGIGYNPLIGSGNRLEVAGDTNFRGNVSFGSNIFCFNITPQLNNTYTCGTTTSRWTAVNTVNLSATGSVNAASVTTTGTVSAGDLSTTGAVNFGTNSAAGLTYDATFGTRLTTPTNTALTLRTGTIRALQISATGRVGINIDPTASHALAIGGSMSATSVTTTGGINANGEIIVTGNGYTSVNDVDNPFVRVKSGTDGIGAMFWNRGSNKLVFNTNFNAYPIRLEGSQVETAGNIQCGGSINANGNIATTGSVNGQAAVIGNTANNAFSSFLNFNKNINGGNTNSGTELGYLTFNGFASSDSRRAAMIMVTQDGAASGTNVPGAMSFHTTSASGGSGERMRISASGNVNINGTLSCPQISPGNIDSTGSITARAFYTTTVLTGTVSQNNSGALLVPNETGAYHFSAYLTSAPGTANIAGMIFVVNGVVTRVSTQFATLMAASAPDLGTSLLIQNLSSTSSPIRISVQRFGL